MKARFKVGQKFTREGKEYEIVDIYSTTNLSGECVKVRYVTKHVFCGQPVLSRDVRDTTIARALFQEHGSFEQFLEEV